MDAEDALDLLLGKTLIPRVGDVYDLVFTDREDIKGYKIKGLKPCLGEGYAKKRPKIVGRVSALPLLNRQNLSDHIHWVFEEERWAGNVQALISATLVKRGRGKRAVDIT